MKTEMLRIDDTPTLIQTSDAARLLSMHVSTVNRLANDGRLRVHLRTPGGHARFRYEDVIALRDSLLVENQASLRRGKK